MTGSRKNGFTQMELLAVIGIIALLASLLLPALTGAKKKSRQVICFSQLRQLGLALHMYDDDLGTRPDSMQSLADRHYIQVPAVLLCAEDPTRNWGGLYHEESRRALAPEEPPERIRYSYINNLRWERWLLEQLRKQGSSAGVAVCQLHGAKIDQADVPSILSFEGLLLRLQEDGAVVRRRIAWRREGELLVGEPWNFFSDQPHPRRN